MITLQQWVFLIPPKRLGRLGVAIERRWHFRPQVYRGLAWTSLTLGCIRLYWYNAQTA